MSALHVLVVGPLDAGACGVYRFAMHEAALAGHGVELRPLTTVRVRVPSVAAVSVDDAMAHEDAVLDRSAIDWADVIVFNRFYPSGWTCRDCAWTGRDAGAAGAHARAQRHEPVEPNRLVRPLFEAFERHPEVLRGRAIVYETDDDLLNVQPWNGLSNRLAPELGVIERMVRRADLVTVATPVLADRLRPLSDEIRVVRNAIDPTWYEPDPSEPRGEGDPRILYYGPPARMRDYAVCRPAVDAVARAIPGTRRVWLGALGVLAGGAPEPVLAAMDEVTGWSDGPRAFARALATARPDIGLAPLVGDGFDAAKSELHWLEYTMAGAVTVASAVAGGGPYDPIRDGVDGFLARDASDWHRAVTALAASRDLRAEIIGRARERVLAEYTVAARASEWADAYRWAAEHAGRAVRGRVHGLGEVAAADIAREGRASLAHRRARREIEDAARTALAALRGTRETCWAGGDGAGAELVSVIVPVVDEPGSLVARAIASILDGTYGVLEILLAVPESRPDAPALAAADPRIRVLRVPEPVATAGPGDEARWSGRQGVMLAAGCRAARGTWIAPLTPEALATPDHVEVLLEVAREHRLEFVYGQAAVDAGTGSPILLGAWPPRQDDALTIGTELFARALTGVVGVDPDAWRDGATPGWALWRDMVAAGVRMAGIEHPVTLLVADAPAPRVALAG